MPIIKALLALNYEVFIITPKDDYAQKLSALKLNFKLIFYDFNRSSLNPFLILKNYVNLFLILRKLKLDIIQTNAHKCNTFGIFVASAACVKKRLCIVEGLGSFFVESDFKSKITQKIIVFLYKISFKLAHKFIFVNAANAAFMKDLGLGENKIKIIKSTGINLKHFCPLKITQKERQYFLQKIHAKADLPIVLMVSRALIHKGVREFYEAAFLLKDKANFIFVGGVDKGKFGLDLDFLKGGEVLYLGQQDDIAKLLNLCDIFVLPSYKEGFPQSVLEAKACAKPCIVSKSEGCVEAVRDAIDGLYVKPQNALDLSEKIMLLIKDKQLRKNLAQNAFKDALNYDENEIAKKYIELYESDL